MLNAFKAVIDMCFDVLNYPIVIDEFQLTLWNVLIVGVLISIFVTVVVRILE